MVLASVLLFFTWNRVVAVITKVKTVTFWQTLLVVATILVFCAPHMMKRAWRHGGGCGYGKAGMHMMKGAGKAPCPHWRKAQTEEADAAVTK